MLWANVFDRLPGMQHDPRIVSVSMRYTEIGNSDTITDSEIVSNAPVAPKPEAHKQPKTKTTKQAESIKKESKKKKAKTEKLEPKSKPKKIVSTTAEHDIKVATKRKKKTVPRPLSTLKYAKKTPDKSVAKQAPEEPTREVTKTNEKPVEKKEKVAPKKIAEAPKKPPRKTDKARYKIGSSDNPRPSYPSFAKKKGWGGMVILGVHVKDDGSIDQMTYVKSTHHVLLNYEAWETVLNTWTFDPIDSDDESKLDYIEVPIFFGK